VPVFALRFQAPLTFHNCLPHALTLTLADSAGGADAATFAVPAGGSHAVYQFDLGRRLSMSIAMAARPAPSTARLALGPSKLSQHVGAAPATGLRTGVSSRGHEGAGRTGIAFCSALQHQRVLGRFTRGRAAPPAPRSPPPGGGGRPPPPRRRARRCRTGAWGAPWASWPRCG